MRRIALGLGVAGLLALLVALMAPRASGQSGSAGCPTGFTVVAAGSGDPTDLDLDGLVCQSEPDVRTNGSVEIIQVDNSSSCELRSGCPPAFLSLAWLFGTPDRNGDGIICDKAVIVGPPGETITKRVRIDNHPCP